VKLDVIVYSQSTNGSLANQFPLSGWPIVWIQDLVGLSRAGITLQMIGDTLREKEFNIRAHDGIARQILAANIEALEDVIFIPEPKNVPPSVVEKGIQLPQTGKIQPKQVLSSEKLLELPNAKLTQANKKSPVKQDRFARLADQVNEGDAGLDLASQFYAIICDGILPDSFCFGLVMMLQRTKQALARSTTVRAEEDLRIVLEFVDEHDGQ
jgi:hypothetical protein